MGNEIRVAPSVLSADFAALGEAVREAEAAGADLIHLDVMDGHFVPNITIGPLVVQAVRAVTELPRDVHLMIDRPERYLEVFVDAGADVLYVHPEATLHLDRTLRRIRQLGARAGVVLNPGTSEEALRYVLPLLDAVMVMTVNPGFGGQEFIPEMLPKLRRVRQMLDGEDSQAWLSVDGGVDVTTAPQVVAAGADVLVAGSAIFKAPEGVRQAIARLRQAAAR
ncbi:MAG: ribulose-phosphate 3-epimerase [Anaerolineales bacterium]